MRPGFVSLARRRHLLPTGDERKNGAIKETRIHRGKTSIVI